MWKHGGIFLTIWGRPIMAPFEALEDHRRTNNIVVKALALEPRLPGVQSWLLLASYRTLVSIRKVLNHFMLLMHMCIFFP